MVRAQTIQIYLPDGDPAGIRVASLTTRTVRVFDVPRTLLNDFLKMPESSQVGVYYLIGSEGDEQSEYYIGQTGRVGERLRKHTRSKDFWTRAMVAVSLTNEWTSTHVAYLEWLSLQAARSADRYRPKNDNEATNPFTPAPLEADCHEFLDTISVLLSTLGVPVLEPTRKVSPEESGENDSTTDDKLTFTERGCQGSGYLRPAGLLVLAGSLGRTDLRPSAPDWVKRVRQNLMDDGVVTVADTNLMFVKDHLFNSPSTAGAALAGGHVNGRTTWKNTRGEDLHTIEAGALADATTTTDDEPTTHAER